MSNYTIHGQDDTLIVRGNGEALELWNALRRYFLAIRPSRRGLGGLHYPETTQADVSSVITVLSRELGRTSADAAGYEREARAWAGVACRARALMSGRRSDDAFTDNERFWLVQSKHLAVYLSVARHLPTNTELIEDFQALTRRTHEANGRR